MAKKAAAEAASTNVITLADPTKDPTVAKAATWAQEVEDQARSLTITTAEDYTAGASFLAKIKDGQKRLDAQRTSLVAPLNLVVKQINAMFKAPIDKLGTVEVIVKRSLLRYQDEQERIQREEQERLDAIARKEAAKLAAQAAKAEAAGKLDKAEQLQERAATVVAPVAQTAMPTVPGLSGRENWKAECVDLMALVQAIAAGQAPLSLVVPNTVLIGQQARNLKADFVAPGIRVWAEKGLASGSSA